MRWLLLDLAIVVVGLVVIAVPLFGLYRRVRALSRRMSAAGATVGTATQALTAAQATGPLGARGVQPGPGA